MSTLRKALTQLRHKPASYMEVGGCAALTLGTGLVYLPAGIIAAGVLLVLLAWGIEE